MNIKDLAKLSGVAPSTVSKVINNYPGLREETRKKVLETIKKYNYTSNMNARNLSMQKSNLIGILAPGRASFGIDSPFQSVILEGFRRSISELGYDLIFVSSNIFGQDVSYLDHCRYMNLAGILLLAYDKTDVEVLNVINDNIQIVSTNFRDNKSVCEIYSDDREGTRLAVNYLIELNHSRIGYIYGPIENSNSASVRLNSFKEVMTENNLLVNNSFIEGTKEYLFDEGYSAMEKILNRVDELPTAVAVGSDLLAYGAIKAIKDRGLKVPEDISIIGFDGLENSRYIDPALTTIKQDMNKIGACAANKLVEIIKLGTFSDDIIIPVSLVIRESCKKL